MAAPGSSPAEMLSQLEAARKLSLGDPQVYSQVVPGVLPLIGSAAALEVRRWGADFIAECFASASLPNSQKETLVADVLPTLRGYLDNPSEDQAVLRSAVQAAASLYPLVFKRISSHPDQAPVWQTMMAIKFNILGRMDSSPIAVRICCIKFLQKLVQVQTPGLIADPRRPDQNETSLAIVPRQHPLLPLANLEAEGAGFLDRLLSVFQDPAMDPILIDATLNCLAVLIRTRPAVANKILAAIINFNPFRSASTSMTPRLHVIYRSMERTTFALLKFVLKAIPNHPMAEKIQHQMYRLQQQRMQLFTGTQGVKRPAEPFDGLDDAKRQRLAGPPQYPSMPPPPNTVAQLFTLTEDTVLHQFDVKLLPADIVSNVVFLLMKMAEPGKLEPAIEAVRGRYEQLKKAARATQMSDVPMAGPTGIDDEDDYEPDFTVGHEATSAPMSERVLEQLAQPAIDLGPFELPKPPPMTDAEVAALSDQTVKHVFNLVAGYEAFAASATRQKLGFNRLAAAANDRDAWVTIFARLATRAPAAIDEYDRTIDEELKGENGAIIKTEARGSSPLAMRIREHFFLYILDDFRPRLPVAISWLSEEWYADKVAAKAAPDDTHLASLPNYTDYATRLLDKLVQYLDARDQKLLVRFLSEIPAVTEGVLGCVKALARDPERVGMFVLAMQYLIMFRPPARELVLDTLLDVWREGDPQTKSAVGKVLVKYRPAALSSDGGGDVGVKKQERDEVKSEQVNGVDGDAGGPVRSPSSSAASEMPGKQHPDVAAVAVPAAPVGVE